MSQQTSRVDGDHSVEELRRGLAQAREREAVAGEVLRIIAGTSDALKTSGRSSADLQNVLDALTKAAVRLCGADKGLIRRRDGDRFVAVSTYAFSKEFGQWVAGIALESGRDSIVGRAASTRQTVHIPDVLAEPGWESGDWQELADFRSAAAVPLLSGTDVLGVLVVHHTKPVAFTERQIELLETFADQAVIAIENARLFNDLTETVEQQRTTGDILRAIANSPGNAQAVLDSIAESAARLLNVPEAEIMRVDGQLLTLVTKHGLSPQWPIGSPRPINRDWVTGRAIVDRSTIHVADLQAEQKDFPEGAAYARHYGHRTTLATPLLRQGVPIGAILIRRMEVRSFSNKQIKLLESFADQAVIAIENTRLFEAEQASKRELREALDYRTATSDVLNVISRSPSRLQPVFDTLVESAARLCQAEMAQIFRCEGTTFNQCASYGHDPRFGEYVKTLEITPGRGSVAGRVLIERKTVQIADVLADPDYSLDEAQRLGGFRTHMGVPLLRQGVPIGVILLSRTTVRPFTEKQIELAETFADQAVIAIENTRLFEEVQARTRELAKTIEDLEIASQHKSQFVANMSHELRTPLAAILGYAELMQEGFYEPLGQKSLEALTRIRSNGKHLLGLINTVLDIAKIESGQFTLNMVEYAMESVVETVRSATESLAQNKNLAFKTDVAKPLPVGVGDEQRLTQVLLNLVGNAIKFTDAGEVRVTAKSVNGRFAVSVTDTGPGIPEEHQMRIFDQFHQVDSSNTKAKGGTGLGLAIAKQIVEMHGGRIWVESTLGEGSTFQMELPTRAELRKSAP